MASSFNDLESYSLAADLAEDLHAAVARWPSPDLWSVGIQLVRAAGSVGANIAEGSGRWHRADQRRFVLMARGSLYETEHWVRLAQARELLGEEWGARIDTAARSLNGLLRSWPAS